MSDKQIFKLKYFDYASIKSLFFPNVNMMIIIPNERNH